MGKKAVSKKRVTAPGQLFYSDHAQDRVIVADLATMTQTAAIPTGAGPYPIDRVGADLLYVSTRNTRSVTPIRISTLAALPRIRLSHAPRSCAQQPGGGRLALIAGKDRATTSVVDTRSAAVQGRYGTASQHQVVQGRPVTDFGGSTCCGHPSWLPDGKRFFHLDRVARRIEIYTLGQAAPSWAVNTPTSVHHVVHVRERGRDVWYGLCEGNRESGTPPGILGIEETKTGFRVFGYGAYPVPPADKPSMGGHHILWRKSLLWAGCAAGRVYAFDRSTLRCIQTASSGAGCGHVTATGTRLALATNHTDSFMTWIDTKTNRAVGSLTVASAPSASPKAQGHTSVFLPSVGSRGRFYSAAAADGVLFEVDVASRALTGRTVAVPGGVLIQGCYVP